MVNTQTRVFNSPSSVYNTVRRINNDFKRCIHERDHAKEINKRDYKRDRQDSELAQTGTSRLQELMNYVKSRQNFDFAL
jgi:hypothetical protein